MNSECNIQVLESILKDDKFSVLGHGTGRKGAGADVVKFIFENGLRTKYNSLYYTTIGLDIPSTEVLKNKLNNWEHCDSKNIILMRVPIEYINMLGESSDLDCERFGAFMQEHVDETGKIVYYLDSKFIIGNYNAETELIQLNPSFEKELTFDSKSLLTINYKKTLERTKERLRRFEELPLFDESMASENIRDEVQFDDSGWDFPSLENFDKDEINDNFKLK